MPTIDPTAVIAAVQDAVSNAKTAVEGMMKASTEASQQNYEQTVKAAQENLAKAAGELQKGVEALTELQSETYGAFVASGTVVAKGAESAGKRSADFTQSAVDAGVAHAKSLMEARTLNDVMDLQAKFARTSLDTLIAEASAMQEMGTKVANEAIAPIQAQVKTAVDKASKAA